MQTTIHILHLEDDPADAELVQARLTDAGLTFRITTVQTRDEFETALSDGETDIILADFRLPTYDGVSALRLVTKLRPDIPFIFVSGTMGEEAAIEALKQGASDYVLKHSLKRLGSAVRRALQEARHRHERKRAEKALAESESKMRSIMENIGVGVALISPKMEILELNKRMRDWFPDIDPGRHPICYQTFNTPPRQEICSYCPACKTLRDGRVHEATTQTPQGMEIRNFRLISTPLFNAAGEVVAAIEMAEDVTERRQAEEALQHSNRINAIRIHLMQFAASHCLDDLLEETVNEAEKLTDSLIGFYHFVDDDQQTLTLQSWSTRTKAQFCKALGSGLHYPVADAGVWVDCVRERKPVVHNDYASLPHRRGLPEGHAQVVRELVVPVKRGEKIKAILGVGNKPADYTQRDVAAMSHLADLVWEITERRQAEQQLALMSFALNSMHEAAFMIDEKARFRYVNDASCRILGYSRDELLAMTVPDINPGLPMERWPDHWRELKQHDALTFEGELRTRDDRMLPVEINANYFEYEGQSYDLGLVRDISERKEAERERLANLRFFESMDRVNRAIQGADDLEEMMETLLDEVLSIFDSDRAFLLYPCDPEAPTWSVSMERCKPEYPGAQDMKLTALPMTPKVAEDFRFLLAADGPIAFGPGTAHALSNDVAKQFSMKSMLAMAIYPKPGRPRMFGIHQCARARVWTAEEIRVFEAIGRRLADGLSSLLAYRDLRESQKFLDNVVEHIPNMLFVKDAQNLRFVRFNRAGEELLGYPREVLLGKTDSDFFPKQEADYFTAKDRQVLDSKVLVDIPEETIHNCNNAERILHTQKMPILDETGEPQYLLGISEDITERKLAEASIRKLSQAIEQSPVSIVITDLTGRIEFVNTKFTQITGYTFAEALGLNPRVLKSGETPAEEYRRLWQTIASGGIWQGEFHNRKKSGELFWEQATIAPVRDAHNVITHYVAVKEDITERKSLEAQLRQVQKMEAIGQLAGGIAHDFNNILSAITGFTEISQSMIEPGSKIFDYLAHVMEASVRAKELINQILMFSRETEQALRPMRVALPVREALKLLRASVPATIEIRSEVMSQATALADPTQVHQIVMNLCTNAAHAMQENGGLLYVGLTDVTIDDTAHRRHYPDAKPGEYINLTISDQGHGIDALYTHRIFDPFFTTKEKGKGTGMGLSVVHGIVKSYNGSIYVHSRPGEGSTFEILIPALESAVPDDIVLRKPPPMGSESILFADDEVMIADIAKGMLESLGYHVTVRTSGIEAFEAFRNNPDGFDLVITDIFMPKMSGLDLAEKILQIRPGLPIIVCTGFSANMDEEQMVKRGVRSIILKPILRRDMATAIRKVLDGVDGQ